MANWTTLKNAIASVIKANGNQEITGATLQSTLNSIVNAVGENATFKGIATPTTNPGTPDGPVFYFASEAGMYSNFGGLILNNPGLVVLYNLTGTWQNLKVYECLQELGNSTRFPVSQKFISDWINKGYQFRGIATPTTNPGTPDGPVFYFASEAGTYSNFGGIVLTNSGLFILYKEGNTWKSFKAYELVQSAGSSTTQVMSQKAVTDFVQSINVSKLYPTEGTDSSNKYTLQNAIAKVPASIRNAGLKVSFFNTEGTMEEWEFKGGSYNVNNFVKVGYKEILACSAYTDLMKLGVNERSLIGSYNSIPKNRRGLGAVFTNVIGHKAKFLLRINNTLFEFDETLTIILEGVKYSLELYAGDTREDVYNRALGIVFKNYNVSISGNDLVFERTSNAEGTLNVKTQNLKYLIKDFTLSVIPSHTGGVITITMGENIIKVDISEEDTELQTIIDKIFAKRNYYDKQVSDDTLRMTFYSYDSEDVTIDGGGVINVIDSVVQERKAASQVSFTVITVNQGHSDVVSMYRQTVTGDTTDNINSDYLEKIYGSKDIDETLSKSVYPMLSQNSTLVPTYLRKVGALRMFNSILQQFVGDPATQWNNNEYWKNRFREIKPLVFKTGNIEVYREKDEYGHYINCIIYDTYYKGKEAYWVVNVIRTCVTEQNITIPKGEYKVRVEYRDNFFGLWWDDGIKNFVTYPKNFDNTYLIAKLVANGNTAQLVGYPTYPNGPSGLLRLQLNIPGREFYVVPRSVTDRINVKGFLPENYPDDVTDPYDYLWNAFLEIPKWYFPKGEYKFKGNPWDRIFNNEGHHVIGAGINDTILRKWNFNTQSDSSETYANTWGNIHFKDLTIMNRGFGHYGSATNLSSISASFTNVKIHFTLQNSAGYILFCNYKGFNLSLKNVEIVCDKNVYCGFYFPGEINLDMDNCKVSGCTKPFLAQGIAKAHLKGLHTIGGQTGIFFGAQKNRPLDGLVVENCIAEGASEECMSFDTYGNNVYLNPVIAELSIKEAIIETVGNINTYYNNRLKIYCDARRIDGSHPSEYYKEYLFDGNEDYLKQFYVVFSQYAGNTFAGTVAKIIKVGIDEVKGQYLLLNTQLPPEKLTLLADTELNSSNNSNYQVASIMSGFFNCTIRNNVIRRGLSTGLALYMSFYNSLVEGNKVENCRGGSYLYSGRMLAKPTWNEAHGNIIVNNIFEGGNSKAFSFIKFGGTKGHHNTFALSPPYMSTTSILT